jgi:hypothetical protein
MPDIAAGWDYMKRESSPHAEGLQAAIRAAGPVSPGAVGRDREA